MIRRMFFTIPCIYWGLLTFATAQCLDTYHIHEIFSSPGNTKTYSVNGERNLTASQVSVDDCLTWTGLDTGSEFEGNTVISFLKEENHPSAPGFEAHLKCNVNNNTGENIWPSFQGLRVHANGWKIQPTDLELSDIDAEYGLGFIRENSLLKTAIVFGYKGSEPVWPTYTIPPGSALRTEQYMIQGPQMYVLGFPPVDQVATGVMYGLRTPYAPVTYYWDCTTDQTHCRATVSFSEPVDGFFVLFAAENHSEKVLSAKMHLGPLKTPCGCRCSTSAPGIERHVTRPINGVSGECYRATSTSSALICNPTGMSWCESATKPRYMALGRQLPNGNYPCGQSLGTAAIREISQFP